MIVNETEISPTLEAGAGEGGNNLPMIIDEIYEYHSQDMRVKEITDGICPTISAQMGMGGANTTTPVLILKDESINREKIL